MIMITLGTQDKSFVRLLKTVDECIENGIINEEVVVQAGHTKYESKNMKIFDLLPKDEYENTTKNARLLITHGGVSSIFDGLKLKIPIIAAPRLKEYNEHTNNHQRQIVERFEKMGYLMYLKDFSKLDVLLQKAKKYKVKEYKSNQKNFVSKIEDFINSI